jgi:hypothetical protein
MKYLRPIFRDIAENFEWYLPVLYGAYLYFRLELGSITSNQLPEIIVSIVVGLAVSMRIDRSRRDKLARQVELLAHNASSTRVFKSWAEIDVLNLISSAKASIEILDSYYNEAPALVPLLNKALENGADRINLVIYMLSPDSRFGGQRLREHRDETCDKSEKAYEKEYGKLFEACVTSAVDNLMWNKRVKLTIQKYSTMPELRLIVIDDTDFIFGWFPAKALNPHHPCFHLRAKSPFPVDQVTVEALRHHFKSIREDKGTESVPLDPRQKPVLMAIEPLSALNAIV